MKKIYLLIASAVMLTLLLGVVSCGSGNKKTEETSAEVVDIESQNTDTSVEIDEISIEIDETTDASDDDARDAESQSVDMPVNAESQLKASDEPVTLKKENMHAEIHTGKGVMKVEFYEKDAPATVANFVKLAKSGFYDGLTFHRVIPNFVIQGGCPNGTGAGGPGYTIKCELDGENQYHDRGVLSMAHAGRDTGGSQFFICHNRAGTQHLDRNHTCFGKVYEGLEVVDAIVAGDIIEKIVIVGE